MKKRTLIIIGVTLFAFVSICLVIAVLGPKAEPDPITPISYASYPNVVENPSDMDLKNYIYALINKDDNIKIKTALNEELLVNIDTKKWKDIQWSDKGTYLSVLGETTKDVFNIYIYNISNQKWLQATLFDVDGVSSYKWADNDTILFTSGGWLHRYKYSSVNEIVKIYQIDGVIKTLSPNKTTILLKRNDGKFQILSNEGKPLFMLDQITIDETSDVLTINEVYYDRNSETLLFVANNSKFYSWDLGDKNAKEIVLVNSDVDLTNLKLLCSLDVDFMKSYVIDGNSTKFFDLNIQNQKLNSLVNKDFDGNIATDSFECNEDKIEFKTIKDNKNSWYELQNAKIEKLAALDEANEMAVKNNL